MKKTILFLILFLFVSCLFGQVRSPMVFSPKSYILQDTIDIAGTPITYTDNTHILSMNAVIKNSSTACNAINISGDSVVFVGNITIIGTNVNFGIHLLGNDCEISGVTVVNPIKHAIHIQGDRNQIISSTMSADSTIYSGIYIMGSSANTNISNCNISGFSYSVEENDIGTCTYTIVSGCQLKNNLIRPSVHFRSGSYSIIVGSVE